MADSKLNNSQQIINPSFLQVKEGTLNPYFSFYGNNFSNQNEVDIYKSLHIEQIKIFGIKTFYIVRTAKTVDRLYGENIGSTFEHSFEIEMFPRDAELVDGRDSIMPFGWNMTDTIVLQCSFDRITDEIKKLNIPDREYPIAGDLIAIKDLTGAIYEIKYVNDRHTYMAMNSYQLYSFSCQAFDYSNEQFDTGDAIVDDISNYYEEYVEPTMDNTAIETEANEYIIEEPNLWPSLTKK